MKQHVVPAYCFLISFIYKQFVYGKGTWLNHECKIKKLGNVSG